MQSAPEMCGSRNFAYVFAKLSRQASASALSATVIMFKIYRNPGTAFHNVACAKYCKYNWNFVALLLLKSRNTAVKNVFFSGSNRVCRMLAGARPAISGQHTK